MLFVNIISLKEAENTTPLRVKTAEEYEMNIERPVTQLTIWSNGRSVREKITHCKAKNNETINKLDKALAQQYRFIADKTLQAMKESPLKKF